MWFEFLVPILIFAAVFVLETVFEKYKLQNMSPLVAKQKQVELLKKKAAPLNTMSMIGYLVCFVDLARYFC